MESLVKSLLGVENPFNSTSDILEWIRRRNQEVLVEVNEVPFRYLRGWEFDPVTSNLHHKSGKFFSVVGLDVYKNQDSVVRWKQPIINQPEVGYLGIICKEFGGVLYFLLQAKIEPGNVNCVQLSPTIQATRSNYTCVHGGKQPLYFEHFRYATPKQILIDQLQSEQGNRFFKKRNRNIVIKVDDDIEVGEDFRWLTLGQIKELLTYDNVVNMDTRTVLSSIPIVKDVFEFNEKCLSQFGYDLFSSELILDGDSKFEDVLHKLSELKSRYELISEKIPLKQVSEWEITEKEIVRSDRRYFRVFGVDVQISNREVSSWCQPILQPMQEGLCVLFAQKHNGVLHFLLQAKIECGNFDVVEFAPTIQCQPDNDVDAINVPFLNQFRSKETKGRVLFDAKQSEEGGRFFHEQNRNVIFLLDESEVVEHRDNYIWLTLGQMKRFLQFNNYLNIQLRSLITELQYV